MDCHETHGIGRKRTGNHCIKQLRRRNKKLGADMNKRKNPAYASWWAMKDRCLNPRNKKFSDYGGRGIQVCERWTGPGGFERFIADMGERPIGTTLDRFPNQNGNYEPGNCRWATVAEQNRNKRDNVVIAHNGETMTAAEWARKLGIDQNLITRRIRSGRGFSESLCPPAKLKTHCPAGHPYDGANLFVRKNGRRECRECMRARCKRFRSSCKRG